MLRSSSATAMTSARSISRALLDLPATTPAFQTDLDEIFGLEVDRDSRTKQARIVEGPRTRTYFLGILLYRSSSAPRGSQTSIHNRV